MKKSALLVAAAVAVLFTVLFIGSTAGASVQVPQVPLPGGAIPKYVDPLPTFAGNRVDGTVPLTVTMEEFQQQVLPAASYAGLPAPYNAGTYVWGYQITEAGNPTPFGPLYPAYTIEAQRGVPTTITYFNNLVNPVLQQYLTVDQTLHWADPIGPVGDPLVDPYAGPVPAVTHLHGGEVPSAFDGHPDSWFTPGFAQTGPGFVTNTYTYPNTQEAATLWYHDHALGVTRLNVYGGLAGFYLLRDPLNEPANLPSGQQEAEIVIQDRMFDTNGQWLFPDAPALNPEHPFWQPEFLGDTIVVNGKTWPYLDVEPRRYRFRLLNGSNARFYELNLPRGLTFWQIGTDGGLLDTPVEVNKLLLAPGERADVIVDFAKVKPGTKLIMTNNARAPFPQGATPDPQTVGQIMQFRVGFPTGGPDTSYNPAIALPGSLRPANPIVGLDPAVTTILPDQVRQLTLNEVMGAGGPLEALLNNTKWDGTMSGLPAPGITEMPRVGSTEVWEVINLTGDAHPIHLHLVQFQVLSRQGFQASKYLKAYDAAFAGGVYNPAAGPPLPYDTPNADGAVGGNPAIGAFLQGKAAPPAANETGWKDTVIMYPGEVTRIVVRWAPQDVPVNNVSAGVNTFPFDPTAGPGYVWHCHILDHEDNEMMRPYTVAP
ncbi:MAG: multicopper oxidase domain-containing protein [Dehalococcoidia bacterium]|nr:MAG: multicopper oxidase domain-containing protein [Dehalococcoidia bacterium]